MGRAERTGEKVVCALAPVLTTVALATGGCGDGGGVVPNMLVDGSPARTAAVSFTGVDTPVFLTTMRSLDLSQARADTLIASCLRADWSSPPALPVAHRVGASGESVTFPSASWRTVQACDGAGGSGGSRGWCGHAFGRIAGERLSDPRLDLGGCRTDDGDPIAFVWVQPLPDARYVVVGRAGYSEAYEVVSRLPVRVAVTEDIDLERSHVVVDVSEHTATGRLLRARELEAVVSG